MNVQAISPKIMVNPSPDQNLSRRAMGRIQRAVVRVVSIIGSRRLDPASTRAVNDSIHFRRLILIASIRIIPWFTAIPVQAINPIQNGRENGLSRARSHTITNGSDIITEYRTITGWEKLLKSRVKRAKIAKIARKKAVRTAMIKSLFSAFSPQLL